MTSEAAYYGELMTTPTAIPERRSGFGGTAIGSSGVEK